MRAAQKLTMPVLAIGGGGHGGFGDKEAEQTRKYATNVQGLSIPNLRSLAAEECPGPLNEAVLAFLASNEVPLLSRRH